jgi:release factor glutamine methyltransferase
MTISIADALRVGSMRLHQVAENPRLEARLLLAHALGLTLHDLIRDRTRPVDPTAYEALLARRLRHEPIAYLLGHREFWSLDFLVSPATLIPRPDTETVVEAAITACRPRPPRQILDLGTGTGCLLLSLLHEFPAATGVGIDLHFDAAALARQNAHRLGLAPRAQFAVMHWTAALSDGQQGFDLVVSNPPYIPAGEVADLMADVADFEPHLALDGGADGLAAYREIIRSLHGIMQPDGVAVLELGLGQADLVGSLADQAGYTVSHQLDLAAIPRAIVLKSRGA